MPVTCNCTCILFGIYLLVMPFCLVAPQWKGNQPPPAKLTIDIKGNGTILCDAIGDRLPTFVWYKNGDRIISST